jgi:hypothetical protein
MDLSGNYLQGTPLPDDWKLLPVITEIDLEDNHLSGPLPQELRTWSTLR